MSEKMEKKLRRIARKRDKQILPELKAFINELGFWERVRVALRVIRRKF